MFPMPGVVHVFKDCTFEGNQINVQVTNNNNNNTTNKNYGQQQSGGKEGERPEHDGGTQDPPHQGSQAPNAYASANFQQQSQPHSRSEDTDADPCPLPSHHSTSSLNGNSTPSSMPGLVTPSSSCMSNEAESSSSNFPATSESEPGTSESELLSSDSGITSPKQLVTEEEGGVHLGDSTGNVPGEEDGDGEEAEDEGEAAAAAGDEKWETESKKKERDGNPRELGDVRLSVEETDHEGAPSTSMPAAGHLLDMGSGLTSAQQPGDQPMSLRSTPSVMHRPVTINNTSSAEQVQEEEPQAQLTAQLLGDLARSDARDMYTAAQDEMDPDMIARLVRLRADEDITENRMSSEPEEDTVVNPTEQATGPSNGEACPPQPPGPRISLHVSPPEPVEGDRVDFELLNVPLHGISDVVWNHNGRPLHQAAGLHHTIHSVSQNDAGIYQCIIYGRTNIVAVVEVTLNVKKSTDVAGQPYMEEEGGSGGGTGNDQQHPAGRSGDTSRQTDAPLPDSGNTPGQPTQGGSDHAAETSVLGATTVNPDYESLQQRYLQGQKLMKQHEDLSYYPDPFLRSPFPADLRDCVVMNAGETTTTPFDPMLEKLTAVVVAPATPKKKSPPNRTAPLALSIERKDSAPFIRDGSSGRSISGGEIGAADHEMDRPRASGSSDRSGEEPSGSGSSRQPGQGQKDAQCPYKSPTKPRKVAVPAQPDIDPIYYKIPLSELMDDADLLDEIKYKLDQDCCGRKNWENLGAKFGIPRDQLKHFAYNRKHTEAVLERVSSQSPDTSVGDLMNKLYQMKRGDVVDVIKENMCT